MPRIQLVLRGERGMREQKESAPVRSVMGTRGNKKHKKRPKTQFKRQWKWTSGRRSATRRPRSALKVSRALKVSPGQGPRRAPGPSVPPAPGLRSPPLCPPSTGDGMRGDAGGNKRETGEAAGPGGETTGKGPAKKKKGEQDLEEEGRSKKAGRLMIGTNDFVFCGGCAQAQGLFSAGLFGLFR